jgi:hypothetical protein
MNIICCRAKVSAGCFDGQPTARQFFGDDLPQDEDGTYQPSEVDAERGDPAKGTIVCDPCYIALMPLTPSGKGLNSELPEAIEAARARRVGS